MDTDQVLEILVDMFERKFGRLPMVGSPETVLAHISPWTERNLGDGSEVSQYGRILVKVGYIPCRDANGKVCFVFLRNEPLRNGEDA